jgi:CheY-like chemotaxis protein
VPKKSDRAHHAMLLDIQLPDIDGVEALNRLAAGFDD